jgi:hypothetical protein
LIDIIEVRRIVAKENLKYFKGGWPALSQEVLALLALQITGHEAFNELMSGETDVIICLRIERRPKLRREE